MRYVRGRVMDIGCGAGRHALYLQNKGVDVVGIDISPLAIEVCRKRGLKNALVMSITGVGSKLGVFDTIMMMGNNFGLFGSNKRAKWLLKKLNRITTQNGKIIATTIDVYDTEVPEHLEYQALNRSRGRLSGQLRLRVKYKRYTTPWFDYLIVSKEEMESILKETDWRVSEYLDDTTSARYIAIIDKKKA